MGALGVPAGAHLPRERPPATGADWRRLDIRSRDDVTALALQIRPDAVFNAAYRQPDWEATADGGTHVALAAAAAGARLVHVSSDALFSGTAPSYDETSQPDPVTPYGAAKAAAGTAVKGITPAAIDVRLDSTRTQARLTTRLRGHVSSSRPRQPDPASATTRNVSLHQIGDRSQYPAVADREQHARHFIGS